MWKGRVPCTFSCGLGWIAPPTCEGRSTNWALPAAVNAGSLVLHAQPLITAREAVVVPQEIGQESWEHMLLDHLDRSYIQLSLSTYSSLLQCYGNGKNLLDGKRIHDHIVQNGLEQNMFLANRLGHMYVQCGALQEARVLFANMLERDVFSWNFLIRAYALQGQWKEAFQISEQMQWDEVKPDRFTFVSILSACVSQAALGGGKQIHILITKGGYESDILVANVLVNLYGKCGSLEDAQKIFDEMSRRDLVSWNSMIVVYAQNGQANDALYLCQQMRQDGVRPDRVTFISLLSACANQAALLEGEHVRDLIMGSGFESDVAVGNALVNMYGKCGILDDAMRMFEKIPNRDIISWNAMIVASAHNGQGKQALQLFGRLHLEGAMPNKITFVSILNACACEGALGEGERMHARILCSTYQSDLVVETALVDMYGKCGRLDDAWRTFNNMFERNVISWNAMIAAYAQHQKGSKALKVFDQMRCEGVTPNTVTFASVVSACGSHATLAEGKQMHALVVGGDYFLDVVIGTALVHLYGRFGCVKDAYRIFDKMPALNLISWNAMIAAYAQHGECQEVLCLCDRMQQEGSMPDQATFVSILSACATQAALRVGEQMYARIVGSSFEFDVCVGNALVNMYGKCGVPADAWRIFESMPERNVVSWNAIIAAYTENGQGMYAIHLFHTMQWEGVLPDEVTFVSVLDACTMQAAVSEGKRVHTYSLGSGLELDVAVGTALVSMYGKCGRLTDSRNVFDITPKQNVLTWNAMISVYAQNGQGEAALQLFRKMQQEGLMLNEVTFVSVLSGCSHAGLVDEGCHCFISMFQDHDIIPRVEHYNCMIDLLGRAGKLDEAEDLVNNMPLQPTIASLKTLLGACRYQGDVQRGERTANVVFKVDPDDATPYIMLSDIYSAAGKGILQQM